MSKAGRNAISRQLLTSAAFVLTHFHTVGVRPMLNQVLWEAQDGLCVLCGEPMQRTTRSPHRKLRDTLEHIYPQGMGGPNHPGNLALSHAGCNNKKAGRWPTSAEVEALDKINGRLGWTTVSSWEDVHKLRRLADEQQAAADSQPAGPDAD